MGRQSSRLWFGRDHKDIYFNGHYHKAMYLTDGLANPELVWEKLANEYFAMRVVDYMADYTTGEMPESGTPGYIAFDIEGNYTIDWGDGTSTKNIESHTYPTSNGTEYAVKISGDISRFTARVVYENAICSCVTEILTPLLRNMTVNDYYEVPNLSNMFSYCSLLRTIPENLFENMLDFEGVNCPGLFSNTGISDIPSFLFAGVKNWMINGIFTYCPNLYSIQPNVFTGGTFNSYSVNGVFTNCENLRFVYDYPNGIQPIFTGCNSLEIVDCEFVGITSAREIFNGLRSLKSVGKYLFKNSPDITSFASCFKDCNQLGEIPEELFEGLEKVASFQECFRGCRSLKEIPNDLFKDTDIANNFSYCFYQCTSIDSIPNDLFEKVEPGADFMATFTQTHITSIPLDLFSGCATDSNFQMTFEGCEYVTSQVPDLWNYSSNGYRCYNGCDNAANYDDIPDNWK